MTKVEIGLSVLFGGLIVLIAFAGLMTGVFEPLTDYVCLKLSCIAAWVKRRWKGKRKKQMKLSPVKSKSGNIKAAGYDAATKTVTVEFNGSGLYRSTKEVPAKVWNDFEATFQTEDSSGSHFHKNLKQFEFKKVEEKK